MPLKSTTIKLPALSSRGVKRSLDNSSSIKAVKKAKVVIPININDSEEEGVSEDEEDEVEVDLSPEVKNKLDYLTTLLEGLSKGFLEDVMKELPDYMGPRHGTNREMAGWLADHLSECAQQGSDLKHEGKIIKRINGICWDDPVNMSDSDEDKEEDEGVSEKVQGELDYLSTVVEGLTKSYLKDVMKQLPGFYGSRSGTNKYMQASIIEHLEEEAKNGSDLKEEERIIKSVDRACYGGGCGEDSE